MNEEQLYNQWHHLKFRLQTNNKVVYFKEGQIWWCHLGQNIGSEVYGKGQTLSRPVLIFKKLSANLFLSIPLSSQLKNGSWYINLLHQGKKTSALLYQCRVLDKKRLIKRIGQIDDVNYKKIKTGFNGLYCQNIHLAEARIDGESQK
jgi:mRNA interferase MazF